MLHSEFFVVGIHRLVNAVGIKHRDVSGVKADLDPLIINSIVNGDWHPRPLESVAWLEESLIGAEADPAAIRARVEAFLANDEVEFAGVTADDLMAAMEIALNSQGPVEV